MSIISYTCAKTNVPIRALEMCGYEDHPRRLLEIRYWENGSLKKIRGGLAGEELCLLGAEWGHAPVSLIETGLHDEILRGTAFVLAPSLCGDVPDSFRGLSHEDPGQGDLMLSEELQRYIDEQGRLPSFEVYRMLYCDSIPIERAAALDDETLISLGRLNRRLEDAVREQTGHPVDLQWRVGRRGSFSVSSRYFPEAGRLKIGSDDDLMAATHLFGNLGRDREASDRRAREYKVPSLEDINQLRLTNTFRAMAGLEPFWIPGEEATMSVGLEARP
ncbi:hypothetical protein [Jiella sp. M17.18]|uniref:hypothetical protein n=1 Tax=Jiella sp. M17.18 TaxID=3234247 RepID=UPI0034DFD5F7